MTFWLYNPSEALKPKNIIPSNFSNILNIISFIIIGLIIYFKDIITIENKNIYTVLLTCAIILLLGTISYIRDSSMSEIEENIFPMYEESLNF